MTNAHKFTDITIESEAEFAVRDYVRCQRSDVTLRKVDSGLCVFDWTAHTARARGCATYIEVAAKLGLKRDDYI